MIEAELGNNKIGRLSWSAWLDIEPKLITEEEDFYTIVSFNTGNTEAKYGENYRAVSVALFHLFAIFVVPIFFFNDLLKSVRESFSHFYLGFCNPHRYELY